MKKIIYPLLACIPVVCLFLSCNKQSSVSSSSATTFIKSIVLDRSISTVNSFILSDGNYLLVGKDPANRESGLIIKMNTQGVVLWQKKLSHLATILWKAVPLEGKGFIIAGFDETPSDLKLNIVQYNNDGDSIAAKTILPGVGCSKYSMDIIQLSSGNFAISGSLLNYHTYSIPYLIITDKSFNELYRKEYEPLSGEYNYYISGMCELADGTIGITGFFNFNNIYNPFLLKAFSYGVQKSFSHLGDTILYETPGAIAVNNSGNLIVAGSSANIGADLGELVNYKNAYPNVVSGTIGIHSFDKVGNFLGVTQYSGYPNNGLINTIKATQDGGYVLCGTVNQLDAVDFSNTEIFVLKIDAEMNKQWSNIYETVYPSFGVDVCQTTDGGYLISGHHQSFATNYNMVLIKTDANGNANQSNN